nr:14995_t:CDS:2 [Entrophospora candida]
MSKDSAQGAVQEFPGLYNYPLFLKELNYTNLLMLEGMHRRIPEILQMLTNVGLHLDINLYDNSNERVEETLDCLKKLISTQRCFLNLRLVFKNGPGKRLIEIFQSRPEFFKRLELVK